MSSVGANIKKMAGNTLVYGLGNIFNRAITFLLLPLYINMMTPVEYGALNLIYPFLALMNVIYMYGLDASFMRFFIPEKDQQRRQEIFSVVYLSILGTTAIITAALFLSKAPLASLLLGDDPATSVFALAFIILMLDGLSFMPVLYYRSIQKPLLYVSIIFSEVLVNLGLNVLLVGFWGWGLKGVLVANICSSLVKLLFASPAIFGNLHFTWNTRLWRDLLKFGLPTVPAVLFAMVVALGDRFLIKHFFDQATVGIYSAGYKIGMIMALMVTAFRFAWHPFFLSLSEQENAKETFARILTLFLIMGSFVFLLVSLLAPPVLTMDFSGRAIITPEYADGLRIVPLILLAYLFQGVYVNLVVGMYLKKKTYLAPLFTGTGMVINLSTNLILMGVLGFDFMAAGIAALASYIGQSFLLWIVSKRFYPIPYEGTKLIKLALLVAVLFFLPQLFSGQAIMISFVVVLAYFPLLPVVGVLKLDQIKSAARQLISRKTGRPLSECDLSIVLPVYNDQENLDRILVELLANHPDKSWEVIVVDDGSPTPLQLTLEGPSHWKMFRNENRQGAASARNQGVRQASGKFVSLLSVFLKIPENYISQVAEFIKNHHFDVAQHLLKKAVEIKADYFQEFLADQSGRLPAKSGTLPVKNTVFTAAILKKEVFSKLGGFDENMNHYGGHELDFAYRLDQQGYSIRLIVDKLPLERVKLESHASIRDRLQEYGKVGLPALLKKHPELKRTILLYPLVWSLLTTMDLPKSMERRFQRRIEQNLKLTRRQYRLYLHLIMRNAWDAR